MIVSERRRRLSAAKCISDVQQGDFVRRVMGSRKVGVVEEVHATGFAWVAWSVNRHDYLPLAALRKVHPGGSDLDVRRK